jgi:hypothetical protein
MKLILALGNFANVPKNKGTENFKIAADDGSDTSI